MMWNISSRRSGFIEVIQSQLWKRTFEILIANLSIAVVFGFLTTFFAYSISYGQVRVFDKYLFPAFSSVDLATNVAVLAIPFFQNLIVTVFSLYVIFDISNGTFLRMKFSGSRNLFRFILPVIGIISAAIFIAASDEKYLFYFRLGVLVNSIILAYALFRFRTGGKFDFSSTSFGEIFNNSVVYLAIMATTLSAYGSHESISRMRDYDKSKTYLDLEGHKRKVVIVLSTNNFSIIFDGINMFILESKDYKGLVVQVDPSRLQKSSYLDNLIH